MKNSIIKIVNIILKTLVPFGIVKSESKMEEIDCVTFDNTTEKYYATVNGQRVYVSKNHLKKLDKNRNVKTEQVTFQTKGLTFQTIAIV